MVNTFVRIGVSIGAMVLSRLVDTSNPDMLFKVRVAYVICVLLNAGMNYYIRTIIRRKHDDTKIYIVNSMLGQEMVEETTYFEKEEAMCSQSITSAFSGVLMTLGLMSFKMGLHYGMIMQIIQLPFNIYWSPLFQKHILNYELDHPWKEQTEVPISKMSKEGTIKAMKDEIQKCWDDGELAKYDSLLKLVPITGANVVTDKKWSALMIIMGNPLGDVNCILKFLQAGADLSLKDDQGWNCLHWAAYHSNVAAVEIILEKWDSTSVLKLLVDKNDDQLTPLELAKKEGQDDFVAWVKTAVKDEIEVLKDLNRNIDDNVETLLMPLLEDKE